ncbi:MAG: hypothetical protein IJA14_04370 [Alphaproteobacteria bacterium]|nr:hypothetical protein [Alphaproteobacteria bacterium]
MEDNAIFEEIEEELKHDQVLAFFRNHKKSCVWTVAIIVAGIVIHSSWYTQKKHRMEITTTNLFHELYASGKKSDAAIENLKKNAPAELVPLLSLIHSGRKISSADEVKKYSDELLELSKRNGIDPIWRDLAILIYASHSAEASDQLIKRLEPLCGEDRPFKYSAMERIAMIHDKDGNFDKALEMLDKITSASDAPASMKNRIAKLANYIRNNKTVK